MSDVFARIMGGMTKAEARKILRRNPSVQAMNKVLNRYGLQALRYKGDIRGLHQQLVRLARARGVPRRSLRQNGEMCQRCGRVWLEKPGICSHCQAREQARKQNPPPGPRPGEVEIYADVERIFATKGARSTAAGERFVHNFRHAAAYGRPDGTVILRGRGGRRLWDHFRA